MEVTTETTMSDATATLVKSDEHGSESEAMTVPTAETEAETSDGQMSSHLTPSLVLTSAASPSPASQSDSSPQTHVPVCQPEAPETEITPETGTTSH